MSEGGDSLHPAILALKCVCRCNNVKYKTIQKAIESGARTIKDVAARTTATTGYCGGTCTPDVQAMIDTFASCTHAEERSASASTDWWARPAKKRESR